MAERKADVREMKLTQSSSVLNLNWNINISSWWWFHFRENKTYFLSSSVYFKALETRTTSWRWEPLVARFQILFSTKRNKCSLENWLIPDLRQDLYKVSLDHHLIVESKEVMSNEVCQRIGQNRSRVNKNN